MSELGRPAGAVTRAQFLRYGGAALAVTAGASIVAPGRVGAQATGGNDANVKAFGAVGDGVTDDTAAIQAAINGALGVYFPAGRYRCTSTITLRNGSRLVGEALGSDPGIPATQLDFSGFNYGRALQGPPAGIGNGHGVTISNLWVKGRAVAVPEIEGFPNVGYYARSGNRALSIVNSAFSGFTTNCQLEDVYTAVLLNVRLSNAVRNNLVLWGACYNVRVLGCDFTVTNESGNAAAGANVSNIWLLGKPTGRPRAVTIQGCVIDEVARLRQTTPPSTVYVEGAEDVVVSQSVVWVPVNDGSGYGIRIGAGSARIAVSDLRVEPFEADSNHVPKNTVWIEGSASGVVLTNVTTNANGGGDIADEAADTVWINVNGTTKLRGGTATGAVAALPAPTAAHRGQLLRLAPGGATPDTLHFCAQTAPDAVSWLRVADGAAIDALSTAVVARERRLPGMLTGLLNWYDLSEAAAFGAVPDLSGQGRTAGARYGSRDPVPATDPALFGGKRFARFDGGVNRALVAPTATSGPHLTVMVVGRVAPGASTTGRLFALSDGKGPDFANQSSCLVYHSAANVLTSYRNALLTSSEITDGTPFALFVTYDGTNNRHQVTEGTESGGVASAGAFASVELVIGGGKQTATTIGAYALACDIVEVAVWNRRLPTADLAALGTYARRWWAL